LEALMKASTFGRCLTAASALALAGCAIADVRPGVVRHMTPKQIWQQFHGPGVRIRAQVVATSNSRLIEPVVSLSDSAYLVIGDIGDDGTMRIVYPTQPGEANLIKKGRSFEGPRFQPRVILPFMRSPLSVSRTAPGYAFVIASSLPLDLSKLAEGEHWSTFDVYYDNHMIDPRPAITDLAAAISSDVGQISISYAAYAWGFTGPRSGMEERMAQEQRRRRLPRPPG
jgi:hypothetical protein